MTFFELAFVAVSCLVTNQTAALCLEQPAASLPVPDAASNVPVFSGEAVDVVVSAESVLVWDVASNLILYDKQAEVRRPIASLVKLLTTLVIRDSISLESVVTIPPDVRTAQREGANIRLPIGEQAVVSDLLSAGLIASANDAVVALAVGVATSEKDFVERANRYALQQGLHDTKVANATGLSGGEQYSTAFDVHRLLLRTYQDPFLRSLLSQKTGVLRTLEGSSRQYTSTNKLLDTYLPIAAAKTGYTIEAGENLAIITKGPQGQHIGVVVLGSADRFQDTKVLVEWVWRNYTW